MYSYFAVLFFSLLSVVLSLIIIKDRFNYLKEWKKLSISTLVVAIPFLIWDEFFTHNGVWGFSEEYITGIKIGNLPIEEVLFFFIIPFCSIFIYHVVKKTLSTKLQNLSRQVYITTAIIGILSVFFSLQHTEKIYTFINFFLLGITLIINAAARFKHLYTFYISFLFILIPFFIVNGVLTFGIPTISENPIVWYDNLENLNFRIISIPIEDAFYGFSLLLLNVNIFEFIGYIRKKKI